MNIALFCYDTPHKKTQDFVYRMLVEEYRPTIAIGSRVEMRRVPVVRYKFPHINEVEPEEVFRSFNIPYVKKGDVAGILREKKIDVGIVTGAGILKQDVIDAVRLGIVNFHPGLIPGVRGQDSLLWAIHDDLPLGVTAHFIDKRVDAGRIILQEEIPVFTDDTLLSLWIRLSEKQESMLPKVLWMIQGKKLSDFWEVKITGKANSFMPDSLQLGVVDKLPAYLGEQFHRMRQGNLSKLPEYSGTAR